MRARDFIQKITEANLPQTVMPQGKQPKLNLPPLVKGLILHWFLDASTRRVTTHDFVREIGLDSAISTVSPILY